MTPDACRPVEVTVDGQRETVHLHGGEPTTIYRSGVPVAQVWDDPAGGKPLPNRRDRRREARANRKRAAETGVPLDETAVTT